MRLSSSCVLPQHNPGELFWRSPSLDCSSSCGQHLLFSVTVAILAFAKAGGYKNNVEKDIHACAMMLDGSVEELPLAPLRHPVRFTQVCRSFLPSPPLFILFLHARVSSSSFPSSPLPLPHPLLLSARAPGQSSASPPARWLPPSTLWSPSSWPMSLSASVGPMQRCVAVCHAMQVAHHGLACQSASF